MSWPESLTAEQWSWVSGLLVLTFTLGAGAGIALREWWLSKP